MKFAFMSFSTPELTLADTLALAKNLGYNGIEPRLDADHSHGVEISRTAAERESIRRQADRHGIPFACLATSCRYADPENRAQAVEDTHERIDLAADVGCSRLRVFGGNYPEKIAREDAVAGVASALSEVADHAQERGVTLCLETHDAWCDPQHVAAVMRAVNHPAVAVNWDVMHPVRTGAASVDEAFETLRPWIRHAHIHDGVFPEGKLQFVPIGRGEVDHKRLLQVLAASKYEGFLSGEWIKWEPAQTHLPRELATLHQYMHEATGG